MFRGPLAFLSNMHQCDMSIGKIIIPSSEHLFHACKARDVNTFLAILAEPKPDEAKRMGSTIQCRDKWDKLQIPVMIGCVHWKFKSNPHLLERLESIKDEDLVEYNTWHSNVWGHCICEQCRYSPKLDQLGNILRGLKAYGIYQTAIDFLMNLPIGYETILELSEKEGQLYV